MRHCAAQAVASYVARAWRRHCSAGLKASCAALLLCTGSAALAAGLPPAEALLRGVEVARESLEASSLEMVVSYRTAEIKKQSDITVLFDGDRRRFEIRSAQATKGGIVTIFDGSDAMHYSAGGGSTVLSDLSGAPPDYVFDPRTLGIMALYLGTHDIDLCLGVEGAKVCETVAQEVIGDRQVWRVHVVDKHDRDLTFWIEECPEFRVHQFEYRFDDDRSVTRSEFDLAVSGVLPVHVETIDQKSGVQIRKVEMTIKSLSPAPDGAADDAFSLAALKMAVGTPVSDLRLKRRIGYWNGRSLAPETAPPFGPPADPASPPAARQGWSRSQLLIVVNSVLIACIVVGVFWRRHRSQKQSGEGS